MAKKTVEKAERAWFLYLRGEESEAGTRGRFPRWGNLPCFRVMDLFPVTGRQDELTGKIRCDISKTMESPDKPIPVEPQGFFNPTRAVYRFTLLIFVAALSFGSYFAYDIVSGIAPTLVEALNTNRSTVGAFFTFYHIAATVLVLIGGILIDKLGTRKASLLFSFLVLGGAVLVWTAQSIPMFFLGRFIFGAGAEPLIVAQSAILARWFKNKELALSFGLALTVSRMGSLFAFNTGELLVSHFGSFRYALFGAVIACVLSLVANFVYIIMDRRGQRALSLRDESIEEKVVFKDIKEFKAPFWYITLLCVTFYSAIFPFTDLATDFFAQKWGLPLTAGAAGSFLSKVFYNFLHILDTAPGVSSIIIFASMILAPFAGRLVDKYGKRATVMIIGSLIMIPSHALMGLTNINPVFTMIALGAAFVLVPAAMWPAIPLVVRKERVGTAFGLMTAVQNIGLAAFPFLNGWLRDSTQNYTASMLMFASLGFVGLIFAMLLKRADAREGHVLEKP